MAHIENFLLCGECNNAILHKIKLVRATNKVTGLERWCDLILLFMRFGSIFYWCNDQWSLRNPKLADKNVVDGYCCFQFAMLFFLAFCAPARAWPIAAYILFEIYLALLNIIFLAKFPAINQKPESVERSLMLLLLNAIDLLFAFTIFYRYALGLEPMPAFNGAAIVLGTVGMPEGVAHGHFLVSIQIILNLVLVVVLIGGFTGKIALFESDHESTKEPSRPEEASNL